jgi:class 3 adenylate cyclase
VRRWSLRTKILIASAGLTLALIVATLAYVSAQAERFVGERLSADLANSASVIATTESDRFDTLQLTAQVIASFPQLRALLEATDAATIRDFLRDYLQRTARTHLLIVLAPSGQSLARTDALVAPDLPDVRARWVEPLLAGQHPRGYVTADSGVYQAAAGAAEAGGTIFGVLVAAARMDDAFAQQLRTATGDEVVIFADDRLLGSSIPAENLPWRTGRVWKAAAAGRLSETVTISGEEYAVHAQPGADPYITFLALQSRDRALVPYRRIQFGLLALGALAFLVGIGGSAFLARTITAPVSRLVEGTRQVAAGNFDVVVDVQTQDELGTLASSFNTMTRGLRERSDMQKFVSQSTLEMIQSPARVSAGERKRLTILFSDIRGFSGFAEQRPPEDAVEWLNRCLGMQADLVRAHHGDVDKFVGDAVFALFGGPDMAFDAVRCAVEIQRQMAALDQSGTEPLELGIGIVTGEVILGSIGSRDRLDFTAIGDQVNLCSRLCAMAGPREILLAESTYSLVRDLVAAERQDAVHVRGLAHPIAVYRMTIQRPPLPS